MKSPFRAKAPWQPVAIDFGVPRRSWQLLLGWGLVLLGLGIVGILAWRSFDLYQKQQRGQADWERLQSVNRAPTTVLPAPETQQKLTEELNKATRVIERLDTPWADLFTAVENAFDTRVTLLAVEPDTERKEVRLTAEAKDLSAMLDYVKQVRTSTVLVSAYVASHQVNIQDPQRPVRFTLLARWVAASPSDQAADTKTGEAKSQPSSTVAASSPMERASAPKEKPL